MLDTWTDEDDDAVEEPHEPPHEAPHEAPREAKETPSLQPLIERALERELARRRALQPHAQLSLTPDADAASVDVAHARLRSQYDLAAYAPYGERAVCAARSIAELLEEAYRRMRQCAPVSLNDQPTAKLMAIASRDDRVRALASLHNGIARRLADAEEHRRAGRVRDAIRMLEAVLVLDRRNQAARVALDELRRSLEPPPPKSALRRFIDRVLTAARVD
jgi:hypothetical protein